MSTSPTTVYPLLGAREPSEAVPGSVLKLPKSLVTELPCATFTPHDADPKGYLSAREDCWNKSVKEWPSVIAMPTSVDEVQSVVKMAAGEKVAVLSGGHSPMCMPDGAFLINMRKMNKVLLDPAAMVVKAEGGAKIGEVDAVLKPHNFAVPLGTHPDTGIGGLTLGGGIGWLTPRVGLAADNLVSAEVVVADGSLVTASADSHADLYWALRGGGGNFGVVVSFTYKVFAVGGAEGFEPGHVLAGTVPFLPDAFDRKTVIEKWGAESLSTSADNVQMLLLVLGGPCVAVFTHHGTMEVAQKALEAHATGYGETMPPKDGVKPMPWNAGVQTLTGMGDPNGAGDLLAPGNPFYYTAGFVENLTPEISAFLAKAQEDAPSKPGIHGGSAIVVMPLHGQFNDVPADATAISARSAKFWVVFLMRLDGDEETMAKGIAWGRELKKDFIALEGVIATDMRLNKPGSIAMDTDTHSVLPSQNEGCLAKLRGVKDKYDPSNLFCYASLSKK